ncbi:MAG: 30S ribosomal protein S1 [Candidatus Sumerlaeia bacterium]
MTTDSQFNQIADDSSSPSINNPPTPAPSPRPIKVFAPSRGLPRREDEEIESVKKADSPEAQQEQSSQETPAPAGRASQVSPPQQGVSVHKPAAESPEPDQAPTSEEAGAPEGTAPAVELDEDLDRLIDAYLPQSQDIPFGEVIEAPVVSVAPDYVLVDVGDKSEGVIAIEEFRMPDGTISVGLGDRIPVIIQGRDEESGQLVVRHRQAREAAMLQRIEAIHKNGEPVKGKVVQAVKGGLIVDIGVRAFLPASHVDTGRVEDLERWVGEQIEAVILDLDLKKRRVVISRRQLLEERRREQRDQVLSSLNPGDIITGTVKMVKDFGAFIEVGGLDAFLPRSEVSWDRDEPSAHLKEGLRLKVKVLDVNREEGKAVVSRKQAKGDPWESIDRKFPVGEIVQGRVVRLSDFGAFIHLDEGVTGLLHVTDMHWGTERRQPSEFVQPGQWVKVKVLSIDPVKRRISLGLKQTTHDPWDGADERYAEGRTVPATVKKTLDKGVVVQLEDYIEGFIPLSELSWDRRVRHPRDIVKEGEEVRASVIKCEPDKRRIVLSLKSATPNPFDVFRANHPKGTVVEGKVVNTIDSGAFVQLADGIDGFCPISHLNTDRTEKVTDAVKIGETYAFKIIKIDSAAQKITLSRKDYLVAREREEIRQYLGHKSESVGPNLGDMLKKLDIE